MAPPKLQEKQHRSLTTVHHNKYNKNEKVWDLSGGSVVKTSPSNAKGAGLILGWGTKIPYALWSKKQKT